MEQNLKEELNEKDKNKKTDACQENANDKQDSIHSEGHNQNGNEESFEEEVQLTLAEKIKGMILFTLSLIIYAFVTLLIKVAMNTF